MDQSEFFKHGDPVPDSPESGAGHHKHPRVDASFSPETAHFLGLLHGLGKAWDKRTAGRFPKSQHENSTGGSAGRFAKPKVFSGCLASFLKNARAGAVRLQMLARLPASLLVGIHVGLD